MNRERVLRAAVALADKNGLEALTMRRLARTLGVEAMSLYNHVANKDDLLSGMVDLLSDEIEMPAAAHDWKDAIRRSSISARELVLAHPWMASLAMSRHSGGPAQLRHEDWLLGTLREAGLPRDAVYHALHILRAYLHGYTVQQLSFSFERDDMRRMAAGFLAQLPESEYPDFAEHVRQHLDPPESGKGGFELGLDLILDGLDRTRATARRTRRKA